MTWKSVCIASMTGDLDRWTFGSLCCGNFMPGMNANLYLDPLGDAVRDDPAGGKSIYGQKAITFLSKFHRVILQHWPKQHVLDQIRAESHVGTKVGLWVNYEAINQVQPWDRITVPLWSVSKSFLLSGANGLTVDPYEGQETPYHSSMVDIRLERYADSFVDCLEDLILVHYRRFRPDFFFFDNLTARPYYGTATNAPPVDEIGYQQAWYKLLGLVQGRIAPVWGHNPGDAYLGTLEGRMDEHFFRAPNSMESDTVVNLAAKLKTGNAHQRGLGLERGRQSINAWFDDPDLWTDLKQAAGWLRDDRVYVQTARTGTSFGLFHPGAHIVKEPR